MSGKILVTYASRTGSTIGVAEVIGRILSDEGFKVDVKPMLEVNDLTHYESIIAGSAIQNGKWLPEAMEFISHNREELSDKTFAAFLVCMTLSMEGAGKYQKGIMDWMEPVRALVRPVEEGYFAGALDLHKIPSFGKWLKFRISVALGFWKEGDHRDWHAIHNWVNDLKPFLKN